MTHQNLLVELFVEELPPKALKKLGEVFASQLCAQLRTLGLASDDAVTTPYASPRRLGAHITHVAAKAADKLVQQKLMPVSVGLDANGLATPALLKRLQALGADVSDPVFAVAALRKAPDGKAEALFYDRLMTGATLDASLPQALLTTLALLPIPKMMSYQLETDCELPGWSSVKFVRPAHGLLALHGSTVVPVKLLGLNSGNQTQGHRFEALKAPVLVAHADDYAATLLRDGAVIASFNDRRFAIVQQLAQAAERLGPGFEVLMDDALLDEVTALVERPNVLTCAFETQFLDVPQECLILTMKANQKYFPLVDTEGKLTHRFLVVSNISPLDASAVIGGNERVVRPRLADAKFFFDQDCKKTLESRVAGLDKVVYHNKLGTQGERMARVCAIAQAIAALLDADPSSSLRGASATRQSMTSGATGLPRFAFHEHPRHCERSEAIHDFQQPGLPRFARSDGDLVQGPSAVSGRIREARNDAGQAELAAAALTAARLAKTDLLTDMVGEFPELQGIMGGYYARHDGLSADIADAIEDHYKPRFAGDALPRNPVGVLVALADKLETLVGMFGIGNLPTGDKDPFALRRHALGVIRMLVEKDLALDVNALVAAATPAFGNKIEDASAALLDFVFERFAGALREQGYSALEVDAVLALRPQRLGDVPRRLAAVRAFTAQAEAPALAAANKRISNILKKADADAMVDPHVSGLLLKDAAEKALYAAMQDITPRAQAQFDAGDYTAALQSLAALRAPVDAFFDGVMVNAEAMDLRLNRLGLLKTLHLAMNQVADLSRLAA